jgi:hypothetical protein
MKRNATPYSSVDLPGASSPGLSRKRKKDPMVSPSESVIRNILNYSKALAVIKTRESGLFNLVMN